MKLKELQDLENLLAEIPGDEVCNLKELHGMLTAILVGPYPVKPSMWLPYVFNRKGEMPEFQSTKQVQKLMSLLMDLNNNIVTELDKQMLVPLMGAEKITGAVRIDPVPWCKRFVSGMSFWGEDWLKEENDESDILKLLAPIVYFVDDSETGEKLRKGKTVQEIADLEKKLIALMPPCIYNMRKYWRSKTLQKRLYDQERETVPLKNAFSKMSRNEPCFCGSGKKYKKCCGKGTDN